MTRSPASPDDVRFIRSAVERFESRLTLYAAHLLGDVERARDVVQETFLKLCGQERLAIEPRLAEWLFTVCRNAAMDVRRKERHMNFMSDSRFDASPAASIDPADAAEAKDAAGKILGAMEYLSENQQEVIRLKFQHGMSYQQISAITGLSATNVGYLIHTGLKIVRERLTSQQTTSQE